MIDPKFHTKDCDLNIQRIDHYTYLKKDQRTKECGNYLYYYLRSKFSQSSSHVKS